RLKKGAKASKSLKELKGTVAVQVQPPAKPLVTVDNVLKAGGQTVKGEEGCSIKLSSATNTGNGQITVQMELTVPPEIQPPGPNPVGRLGLGLGVVPAPAPLPPGAGGLPPAGAAAVPAPGIAMPAYYGAGM